MSTRSLIAKKIGEDKYLTIYCHSDGYLTYNGALLLDHYNTPEQVNKLLALGDISYLAERLEPDHSLPHSFDYDERQEGVTLAYGRDRGEKGTQAREATLAELDDENNWTEYVYIFDETMSGSTSKPANPKMDSEMFKATLMTSTFSTV